MDDMVQTPARVADVADPWQPVPHRFRHAHEPLPHAWDTLYGPLRAGSVDDLMVVAQLGQSIDGRITTDGRHPTFINGAAGLDHLHRLRALVDAVVVGVGTAVSDDPQLTVRRVAGPNPARVVIDPRGRLGVTARLLRPDGARRIIITGDSCTAAFADGALRPPVAAHLLDGEVLFDIDLSARRRSL